MDLEDRTDEIIKKNYTLWKNINEEDLKKDLKPFIKTVANEYSSDKHDKLIKQIEKTKSLEVVNTNQSHEISDLKRVMEKMDLAENMEKSDLKSELEEVKKENEKLVKKVSKLEAIKKQFENFIEEAENGMFKLLKEITTFKLSDLFPTLSKPLLDRVIFKGKIDLEEDSDLKRQKQKISQLEELEDRGEKGSDRDMGI